MLHHTKSRATESRRWQHHPRVESASCPPVHRPVRAHNGRYEGPYNKARQRHWGQLRFSASKRKAETNYSAATKFPNGQSHHRSRLQMSNGSDGSDNGSDSHDSSSGRDDEQAARRFEDDLRKNWRAGHLAVRILRDLILRREPLDDEALHDLLITANKVLFNNTLTRVSWRWSDENDLRFATELLGTTCKESSPCMDSGYSNLTIILSRPLLKSNAYDRDLLLSAFLHELIHCYLFIKCGINHAYMCDGHTWGFKHIANMIEQWIGTGRLHLGNMRARLEDFGPKRNIVCV